jgi:hypothetical protein
MHLHRESVTIQKTRNGEIMGILILVVVVFALFGALKKSSGGRFLLLLLLAGCGYVSYWKWTTGGF